MDTKQTALHSERPLRAGKKKFRFSVSKALVLFFLLFYTVFLFFPLYIVFITSVTSTFEITGNTQFIWWPENFTVAPYGQVFSMDPNAITTGVPSLLLGFINTMWMTLLPLVVGLMVSGLSAYAYSKLQFPGREGLFRIAFIISIVPLGAFGVIGYMYYYTLGWVGTPLPIIVPGMFGGMGTVFFLKMYYEGIPDSLVEAAKIDGMGKVGIFFKIIFPLSLPAFTAQFIFGFVGGYNNYLGPLLYLQGDPMSITLPLVLSDVTNIFRGDGMENIHCAAAILGMLPLIIIYCFSQKYFIEGIAVGGVKG